MSLEVRWVPPRSCSSGFGGFHSDDHDWKDGILNRPEARRIRIPIKVDNQLAISRVTSVPAYNAIRRIALHVRSFKLISCFGSHNLAVGQIVKVKDSLIRRKVFLVSHLIADIDLLPDGS